MPNLTPVDHDPFADTSAVRLVPVDHDPFENVSTSADVAKSGGIGAAKGAIGIAGAAGDLRHLASAATDYLGGKFGLAPETVQSVKNKAYTAAGLLPAGMVLRDAPSSSEIQGGIERAIGQKFYQPKTTAGEYAQTAGEFLPALVGGEEAPLLRFVNRVALPAVTSETAGQMTKGTELEPYARVAGAFAGPAALAGARRAITPFPATAERAGLAQVLANEGVDLTAGQRTGNLPLQWAESTVGDMPFAGGRPAEMMTNQKEQFTAAVLRRAGENANRATPEVIDNAFRRIGNQFETIGARNHVAPDQQFVNDLVGVRDEYQNLVGPHARAPVVEGTMNDIATQMQHNNGVLTGEQYNAMTSRLARQARNAQADPQLREALQGIRESLDDAFERTLQRNGNTQDLDALRQARTQYRNMMVVERAATGAGSQTAEGLISPSQLRSAVVQQGRRAYARGQGDFADLARAGEAVMRPLPQSGTAPRQNLQHLLTLGGVMAGGAHGGAEGGLMGAMAGITGPGLAGRALMSRLGQLYLGNQALPAPAVANGPGSSLARALVAAEAAGVPNFYAPVPRGDGQTSPVRQ